MTCCTGIGVKGVWSSLSLGGGSGIAAQIDKVQTADTALFEDPASPQIHLFQSEEGNNRIILVLPLRIFFSLSKD